MSDDPAAIISEYLQALSLHERATDDRHKARLDAALQAMREFDMPKDPDWVNWGVGA